MDGSSGALPMQSWDIRARGRVQGVNYRRFTLFEAQARGVRGWVRNEADGSVSALIQHEDPGVLQQLCERLREGPPAALVTALEVEPLPPGQPESAGFRVLR